MPSENMIRQRLGNGTAMLTWHCNNSIQESGALVSTHGWTHNRNVMTVQ